MLVSIVIPVYKSSATLIELSERVREVFAVMDGFDYELIFVNDSPFWSDTCETLEGLVKNNSKVQAIELMRNFGQQPATLCGIAHAGGDYVVTMDDDLQHAPEDIPKLLRESSHDAVIGRFRTKRHSALKRVFSYLKGVFDRVILKKPGTIVLSPFRLIKMPVAKLMLRRNTPYPFIPALLFEITEDVMNVEIEHHSRVTGKSNYSFVKMLGLFSNLVINNSSLLLRLVGYTGTVIAFVAFVYAVVIVLQKLLFDYAIAGWASIFASILFFGGMTLLTLGMVGEYLIRIIATTEMRPTYYVRKLYGDDSDQRPM
jgi:dolichol-phosphate mannosyltransferase/undecaprenyl-phosphate 4-deoxy-4-formamido-L-arabinose transferase